MLWKSVVLCVFMRVDAARILAVIPTPFYSHQVIFQPIWSALSERHSVTVLTTQPFDVGGSANLTLIDASYVNKHNAIIEEFLRGDQNIVKTLFVFIAFFMRITDDLLRLDAVQRIANGSERYDLVIYEQTFPIFAALCVRMGAACIAVTPFELDENLNRHMSLPPHSAITTNFVFPIYKDLSFRERCFSEVFQKFGARLINWAFAVGFEWRVKGLLGANYSIAEAERNVDMVFINTDPVFSVKRPMLPNTLEFDGIRMKKKEILSDEIRDFLSSNPNGTILMSLGSAIKTRHLDQAFASLLINVFAELPYNVLWKTDLIFANLTRNVKQMEWLPQSALLSHENVKLFINHAGLQSVSEALHAHTPLLVLPFCGDNARWARMVQQLDIGITVRSNGIEKGAFKAAIYELISNPKYKNKMIELAAISEDKPVGDLETVVWWTEYVIRHKGAKHLRSELLDMPWYKYHCVDVYALLFLTLYALCSLCARFACFIVRKYRQKIKQQ